MLWAMGKISKRGLTEFSGARRWGGFDGHICERVFDVEEQASEPTLIALD